MLSRLEWLLIGIIVAQLCLSDSMWKLLKKFLKIIVSWLGLWPILSAVIAWLSGKWIPRWISSILSVAVTLLGALSGYYKGYNKGYDDAVAGRPRSWTASIHRMFVKEEQKEEEQQVEQKEKSGGWFSGVKKWFRKAN
ncbi:MAG: hypothetical protein IJS40_02975 [Synergistaceae bacterium]|nr:hypothetical protein [Synergistaceae bacterium]